MAVCRFFSIFFCFFHKSHLRCSGDEPNAVEDRIRKEALKHVSLTVNFASVDFIEQRHENERIENNGKMLRWLRTELGVPTRGNVQQSVTWKRNQVKVN